jgi:hypothetical protein
MGESSAESGSAFGEKDLPLHHSILRVNLKAIGRSTTGREICHRIRTDERIVGRVAQFDKLTALSEVEGKLPDITRFVGQLPAKDGDSPTYDIFKMAIINCCSPVLL